jgi:4-aminobutyrate aminotransferase/4-aminobutyrate aminotransferase/(S)-3-amino-2-methylpropionate transaminase
VLITSLTDHDEVPFVEARKRDSIVEDVDGNTFADHVSAWGSSPLGATPPDVQEAVIEAQRRYGMEITDYIPNEP